MLSYVVTETDKSISVASYLSATTAAKYNAGNIVEDLIMSEDVGFPITGLVVRGYCRQEGGEYPRSDQKYSIRESDSLRLYARTPDLGWALIGSCDTGGASKLRTRFAEVILLSSEVPSGKTPREAIPSLQGMIHRPKKQIWDGETQGIKYTRLGEVYEM